MGGLDGVGVRQEQAGRPEPVGEVVPVRLELGRQATVEDRHLADVRHQHRIRPFARSRPARA
jgi:hypothetical protein